MTKKIAIVSHTFPPASNGQSIVLKRLLENVDAENVCLVSDHSCEEVSLPGKLINIAPSPVIPNEKIARRLIGPLNLLIRMMWWTRALVRVIRQEKCDAIVSCTGAVHELPAAWLAARWTRVEFYPYIFDWYRYKYATGKGYMGRFVQWFAQKIEGPTLKAATKIIVPNEFMRNAIKKDYNIDSVIVRNPTCFSPTVAPSPTENTRPEFPLRIVYTGAIYGAHLDAFRNLLEAVAAIGPERLQLYLYTETAREVLHDRYGFPAAYTLRDRVPLEEVQQIQREADILFLPLAFESAYPELIKTSSPGKMGDYLAAGRPVLVHAPEDGFVSCWFRDKQCGAVVSTNSAEAVQAELQRLIDSPTLRANLGQNAAEHSHEFHLTTARKQFRSVLGWQQSQSVADSPARNVA